MQRYQRQILLPQVGNRGQDIISRSSVLVVGCGGLGHPAAQYLNGMGIGRIGLVDGDNVQESNLHRQVLFVEGDIGKNKAQVLREKLKPMNAQANIEAYPIFLKKNSALELFKDYDLILDGTDDFSSKFMINDVCCFYQKPMIYGSISQFEGQVSVFWKGRGPCYRCLYKKIPKTKIQNCAEAGVLGALPGVIGSLQALEAVKILLADPSNMLQGLIGKMHYFNFLQNETYCLNLSIRPNCFCSREGYSVDEIGDVENKSCSFGQLDVLIDVREQAEWDTYHIPESVHWALSRMENGDIPHLLKEKKIVLICQSGVRAEQSVGILKKYGFNDVSFCRESVYEFKTER